MKNKRVLKIALVILTLFIFYDIFKPPLSQRSNSFFKFYTSINGLKWNDTFFECEKNQKSNAQLYFYELENNSNYNNGISHSFGLYLDEYTKLIIRDYRFYNRAYYFISDGISNMFNSNSDLKPKRKNC